MATLRRCVLSVDIGTRNFAFCLFDVDAKAIVDWQRISLPPKGKELLIPRLVSFVHGFCREHEAVARAASVVAVEQQMTASMRILEAVMHSQFVGRAVSVNPRTVKRFYRDAFPALVPAPVVDGARNKASEYRLGKKLMVNVATSLLEQEPDPKWLAMFAAQPKKDDFADCFAQAAYVAMRKDAFFKS